MDKRTMTALLLTLLVLFIWYRFVMPLLVHQPEGPPAGEVVEGAGEPSGTAVPLGTPSAWEELVMAPVPPAASASPSPTPEVSAEPEVITLETAALGAVFSTAGGSLEELVLREYMDSTRENALVLLRPLTDPESGGQLRSLAISEPSGAMRLLERPFEVVSQTDRSVTFRAKLPGGLVMTKKYELAEEDPEGVRDYDVRLTVELNNPTERDVMVEYEVYSGVGVVAEGAARAGLRRAGYYLQGVVAQQTAKGVKVRRAKPKPGSTETISDAPVVWAGTKSQYFASVLEPLESEGTPFIRQAVVRNVEGAYVASLRTRRLGVAPGQSLAQEYRLFAGPLKAQVVKAYPDHGGLIDYGKFGAISVVLLGILHMFYRVTGNYGVSIILLTIVIRVVLFPLSRKQAFSSYKMQKMQPLVGELREKYKGNRNKLNEEMMKLYKEQGVNPLAGCLPLLLQLPIFFGLFRALSLAIELRQAPFVLWIQDLSQPDSLFDFPFSFLGISSLNVLPLIMTGATVFQQKLMAQPTGDPQQSQMQSMMKFMPLFMAFIFYSMPSGLVLYWTTSTIFGVLEQVLIRRHLRALEERGEAPKAVAVPLTKQDAKKRKFKPRGTK